MARKKGNDEAARRRCFVKGKMNQVFTGFPDSLLQCFSPSLMACWRPTVEAVRESIEKKA